MGKKKGGGAQAHYNVHLFQEGFPTCIAAPDPLGGAGEIHPSLDPLFPFLTATQPSSSSITSGWPINKLQN